MDMLISNIYRYIIYIDIYIYIHDIQMLQLPDDYSSPARHTSMSYYGPEYPSPGHLHDLVHTLCLTRLYLQPRRAQFPCLLTFFCFLCDAIAVVSPPTLQDLGGGDSYVKIPRPSSGSGGVSEWLKWDPEAVQLFCPNDKDPILLCPSQSDRLRRGSVTATLGSPYPLRDYGHVTRLLSRITFFLRQHMFSPWLQPFLEGPPVEWIIPLWIFAVISPVTAQDCP